MDMEIESKHKSEWAEAQKIHISVDLEAAAKQQLKLPAAVDRNRFLYEGPALQRAIYRYNAFWLPLLAKHSESQLVEGPLVVPLDCEWIWHCHRLNPIRYKSDCEDLYGRILDNSDVVSSTQGTCSRQTEEIWKKLYTEELYELDLAAAFKEDISEKILGLKKCTAYDLVSAVKRQSPFFYQVSRPHMSHDVFIEEALARYKGFLHIIRRNKEKSIRRFCVPTYDIDLMWHSHQLHPVSYCEDLIRVHGKVLEHDDVDSDRSKGQKLDNGFSGTTNQWEETFGKRYWRAGAMYRGGTPSPVTLVPFSSKSKKGNDLFSSDEYQNIVQVPDVKFVEVRLEFVGVRGLPESHKGSLSVALSKSQPDLVFNAKQRPSILSESGEKLVASFNCEPEGELLFELVSYCPSTLPIKRKPRVLGSASLSLEDYLVPVSKLSDEKWLELVPSSGYASSKSICLHVGFSFTVPNPALYELHMVCSWPFAKNSCLSPLSGKTQHAERLTRIMTDAGTEVITLQMRSSKKEKGKDNFTRSKEVIRITASGETHTVAEFMENGWSLLGSRWSLRFQKSSCENGHLCMLIGDRAVNIYPGRKLDYEPKHHETQKTERDFVTAVEFSADSPYGEAVALINLKSGVVKVKEEPLLLTMVVLAFVLSDIMENEGFEGLPAMEDNAEADNLFTKESGLLAVGKENITAFQVGSQVELNGDAVKGVEEVPANSLSNASGCGSGCGSGCDSGCGSMVKSGSCDSGRGSGHGNMVKSSGCSGCGGGCGSIIKSTGCGGCGGGCGGCGGRKSGGWVAAAVGAVGVAVVQWLLGRGSRGGLGFKFAIRFDSYKY